MTCKDCIHEKVCVCPTTEETSCDHFKNKADFVEVVKCKDCVCFSYYEEPIKGYIGKCEITKLLIRDDNFFCRDGVRKMAQRKEGADNGKV